MVNDKISIIQILYFWLNITLHYGYFLKQFLGSSDCFDPPTNPPFPPPVSESCELLSVVGVGMINAEVLGASKGNALLHILSAWIKLGHAELHIVMGSGPQNLKQETNYWDWTQADYFTQQYKGKFGKNPQLGPPPHRIIQTFFWFIELIITKYHGQKILPEDRSLHVIS